MPMFTLVISCLTTLNLPWFMDLTLQVPMQRCSLQHQTLLLSPVTSTTGCCFCFGSISSFFLELFPHCSPVAYWAPTDLGSSSFGFLSFFLFILFTGFSTREYCEEGIHRAWTPSQACLCWSCVATSPVDSELCAQRLWEWQGKDKTPLWAGEPWRRENRH